MRALDKGAKQRATLTEVVANLDDSEAAEPLLDKLRPFATQKQRLRQAREVLEVRQREWQTTHDRQVGPLAIWRNVAALDTASYPGKRETLATLGIRAIVYGRNDFKIVASPTSAPATLIGNS